MDPLTRIPDTIVAGTTTSYTRTVTDYPATDGWTLTLYISGPGPMKVTSVAAASGTDYLVTLSASDSASLTPGLYQWAERVSRSGEVHQVGDGRLTVTANIATAAAGTLLCWEEQALAAVRAALAGQLTQDKARFQIAGRAVERLPVAELRKTEAWLCRKLARQRGEAPPMQTIGIEFTDERCER